MCKLDLSMAGIRNLYCSKIKLLIRSNTTILSSTVKSFHFECKSQKISYCKGESYFLLFHPPFSLVDTHMQVFCILPAWYKNVLLFVQDVELEYIAKVTHGFSGADLTEICQRVRITTLLLPGSLLSGARVIM